MTRDNFQRSYPDRKKEAEDKPTFFMYYAYVTPCTHSQVAELYAERREFDNSDCYKLGWRTWWHIGLEEDWNKLSQFHVKLFLVLSKCNTLIKLWRVWKIGKLVFVSVSPIFLVAVGKQVPGVGYMAAHLQQKKSILESTLALRTPR